MVRFHSGTPFIYYQEILLKYFSHFYLLFLTNKDVFFLYKLLLGGVFVFFTGLIVGLILGANISLFLYAIILAGREGD